VNGQRCQHRVCRRLSICAFDGRHIAAGETYTCSMCCAWIQGGLAGLGAHQRVVHGSDEQLTVASR
jgi:hypothetical protein